MTVNNRRSVQQLAQLFGSEQPIENPFETAEILEGPTEITEKPTLKPKPTLIPRTTDKRHKILTELLETERSFLKDIKATVECFKIGKLSPADERLIFTNISDVIEFSEDFCGLLECCDVHSIVLGWKQLNRRMDGIYAEYCKKHVASITRIQELSEHEGNYFKACATVLSTRTSSPPDLASMLLKPVQRVLKYPLLLNELLKATDPQDACYEELKELLDLMTQTANHINEVKRRKDVVDKIVVGKQRNISHGLNKTLARRKQQLKQYAGLSVEPTVDPLYDALEERMEHYEALLVELKREFNGFADEYASFIRCLEAIAVSWEDVLSDPAYRRSQNDSDGREVLKVKQWRHLVESALSKQVSPTGILSFVKFTQLSASSKQRTSITGPTESLNVDTFKEQVRLKFIAQIEKLQAILQQPTQVMRKREKKRLDFDLVRDLKGKGEAVDPVLLESSKEYQSIHDQLLEELPLLFGCIEDFVGVLLESWTQFLQEFWIGVLLKSHAEIAFSFDDRAAFLGETDLLSLSKFISGWRVLDEFKARKHAKLSFKCLKQPVRLTQRHIRQRSASQSSLTSAALVPTLSVEKKSRSQSFLLENDLIEFSDDEEIPAVASLQLDKHPKPPVELLPKFKVVSIYPFNSKERDELSFGAGVLFDVYDERDGWLFSLNTRTGERGWIPKNHTQQLK